MFALGIQLIEQGARFRRIAPGKYDHDVLGGQRSDDRPCRAAGSEHPRHAEQMLACEQRTQRFEEPSGVGVVTRNSAVGLADDRIHRADLRRQRIEPVEEWHHRLLVRHGDVTAAPIRILNPRFNITLKLTRGYVLRAVLGV